MSACWCGSDHFIPFNQDYQVCSACQTLVYTKEFSPDDFIVKNDDTDFYGKNYWMRHQQESFGYSDFETRVTADLTERNLFWLNALLQHLLPPGKLLELGCAHGSFVALLNQAGFDAKGLEMSPSIVEFARRTFGIEVLEGPVENHPIPEGSLDAIALMDVIEHLPDPVATMAHCLKLLKPEGMLLIQTPQYQSDMIHEELIQEHHAFLEQLKPDEHLYLFSRESIKAFFKRLGAEYMQFLPAIYEKYDMFLAVSRLPLKGFSESDIKESLHESPSSRLVGALLEMDKMRNGLLERLQDSEADRLARLRQLQVCEADRSSRFEQIQSLTGQLEASEIDRLARFEQIQDLTQMVKKSEAEREKLVLELGALRDDINRLLNRRYLRRLARSAGFDEVDRLVARLELSRE